MKNPEKMITEKALFNRSEEECFLLHANARLHITRMTIHKPEKF